MNAENALVVAGKKNRTHLSTYMLALFFILLPFEYPMTTFGFGSILRYVGVAVMALALLDIFIDGGKIHFDYRCILMTLWLVFMLASALWAEDTENYSLFSGMYLRNGLMFLLICLVRYDARELNILCKAYMLGLVLLLLFMTFVPGATTQSDYQDRLTLVGNDKEGMDQNYLATVMSLPFGLVFYDFINGKRQPWTRVAELAVCITCLYYVLATGSRTGLLELAIIAIFCFGANWKKNLLALGIVLILLFVLFPLIVESLPEDLVERYSLESMLGQTEDSGSRLDIWGDAGRAILDGNWLIGNGAGSSEFVMSQYRGSDTAIHNYYLAMLLELGLIGFALFTAMGYKMIRDVWCSTNKKIAIAFLGVLLATLFLDVLTPKFFWCGMMLLTAAVSTGRTERQKGESCVKKII